jgi:hypothetical protein
MQKILISTVVISMVLFLIAPQSFAECECDLNVDGSCDGLDWLVFFPDWSRTDCPDRIAAPLPATGQTTSYAKGDDGDLQKGVSWPDPRLTDNGDGTVTDNLTGLIWLKNAQCERLAVPWLRALEISNAMADGQCGLTDGSEAGDWRLPNIRKLTSLVDFSESGPALPDGGIVFDRPIVLDFYWSSTTSTKFLGAAWVLDMADGRPIALSKMVRDRLVLPVRGDN